MPSHPNIDKHLANLSDHTPISRGRIERWVDQFGEKDRELALKVLEEIIFYGTANITGKINELVNVVYSHYDKPKKNIYFVPIGNIGGGASIIARVLRNNILVPNNCVISLLELFRISNAEPDSIDTVIFFEDFSGTGKTIKDWYEINEQIILPIKADKALGLVVLNYTADNVLKNLIANIFSIDFLEEQNNVLSSQNDKFSQDEKDTLAEYCKATHCSNEYLNGYGECGLLLAFKYGCPNNSLPILWHTKKDWESLFDRKTI